MYEWKNVARWQKELLGLLITGVVLILLLSVILAHLQIHKQQEQANQSNLVINGQATDQIKQVDMLNPVDAAAAVSPFVEKLSWYDILILVFLWPIGMMFNKFAKAFSHHIYKLMQ